MINGDAPINPSLIIDYRESAIQCRTVYEGQDFGLTKREYFAGLAMQGLLTTVKPTSTETVLQIPSNIAGWAVKCADELLKAIEK